MILSVYTTSWRSSIVIFMDLVVKCCAFILRYWTHGELPIDGFTCRVEKPVPLGDWSVQTMWQSSFDWLCVSHVSMVNGLGVGNGQLPSIQIDVQKRRVWRSAETKKLFVEGRWRVGKVWLPMVGELTGMDDSGIYKGQTCTNVIPMCFPHLYYVFYLWCDSSPPHRFNASIYIYNSHCIV